MIKYHLPKSVEAKKTTSGFTLIEIMVAISIFLVVVTVSLGAIASIFDANRKSQALKAIMTNLNFAVEVMGREIRFGTNYHCGNQGTITEPQNCSEGNSYISFLSSEGEQVVYQLSGSQIEKSVNGGTSFLGVTAPEITIEEMKFFVLGAGTSGESATLQPRVIILIRGHAGAIPSAQSRFILQTTVSQRVLDVPS